MAKAVVLGSTTKRIKSNVEKTLGILSYDFDNVYPQRIDQAIARSTVETACDNLRARYFILLLRFQTCYWNNDQLLVRIFFSCN